jgi:hypothetical protein
MLKQLLKSLFPSSTPARRPRGRRGFRPALEALEDRRLTSADVAAAAGLAGFNQSYVREPDGGLGLYQGSTKLSQVVSAGDAASHKGIAQVSAGVHGPSGWFGAASAPFVRFGDGTVNEYYQNNGAWTPYNVAAANGATAEISASQVTADAVFVRFGSGYVDEHVGLSSGGWSVVAMPGFIANAPYTSPLFTPGALDASGISAGKDAATGKESVFVNFGGRLYEHAGSSFGAGWKSVASGVASFSASQAVGDTVFAVSTSRDLSEYVNGLGVFVGDNVVQVSAGIHNDNGTLTAAAFTLDTAGHLDEHVGLDSEVGWSYVASGVTEMDAAQGYFDTVSYTVGYPGGNYYQIWQHSGTSDVLVRDWITPK